MKITLYRNESEDKKVNKDLNYLTTLDGYLRSSCSLNEPIFEIESDGNIENVEEVETTEGYEVDTYENYEIEFSNTESIFKCNYIYVLEFNRYYYVTDIIIYNNKLYGFVCVEDYLMSLKDKFLSLLALVDRNEFIHNIAIEDKLQPFRYELYVRENDIDTSDADITFNPKLPETAINFAVVWMNNDAHTELHTIPSPENNLPEINQKSDGTSAFSHVGYTNRNGVDILSSEIITDENLGSFVISLVGYPINFNVYPIQADTIKLGSTDTNAPYYLFSGSLNSGMSYYKVGSFKIDYSSYLDIEPYTKYELYLPYYDYVELKSSDILDCVVNIYYCLDVRNATAKIIIYNHTKDYVIKSLDANLGVKIAINRANNQQLSDEKTTLAVKSAISGISSAAALVGGIMTENPFLVASGFTGLTNTAVEIGTKLETMHEKGSVANNSGFSGIYGIQKPRMKVTKYVKHNITDYSHYFGLPLNQTYRLNQLSGFTSIKDIHLDGLDATKTEIDNLYALLTAGVIL